MVAMRKGVLVNKNGEDKEEKRTSLNIKCTSWRKFRMFFDTKGGNCVFTSRTPRPSASDFCKHVDCDHPKPRN
ncbi:hypothetical protein LIER_23078 [Lithospermum erythrorhizon]|uniref:Uncharacterized protein n=1 Tax=Lithospermum erythrorhizon TaxID=34254 RepID=A0AAV3QYF9_LITER